MNSHDYIDATYQDLKLAIEDFEKSVLNEFKVNPKNGTGTVSYASKLHNEMFAQSNRNDDGTWADLALLQMYWTLSSNKESELQSKLLELAALCLTWYMHIESHLEEA